MPGTYDAVTAALNTSLDKVGELSKLDRDSADGRYPAEYVTAERARIMGEARAADARAADAFRAYRAEAVTTARTLREQAAADVNPTRRTADLIEHQQLVASRSTANDLLAQAGAAFAADRPERAALFLDAARAKGARDFDTRDFAVKVNDALDALDETRKRARAIEDDMARNADAFATSRASVLALGPGMRPDGQAGFGSASERAVANVEAKIVAAASGQRTFAVGDGSNPEPRP